MTKRSSQMLPKTKECWTSERDRLANGNPPLLTTNQHRQIDNRPTTSLMASKAQSAGVHASFSTNLLHSKFINFRFNNPFYLETQKQSAKLNIIRHKLQPHWKNIIRHLSQQDLTGMGLISKQSFEDVLTQHNVYMNRDEVNHLFDKFKDGKQMNYLRISFEMMGHKHEYEQMRATHACLNKIRSDLLERSQ